jgi:hypothetical protein
MLRLYYRRIVWRGFSPCIWCHVLVHRAPSYLYAIGQSLLPWSVEHLHSFQSCT